MSGSNHKQMQHIRIVKSSKPDDSPGRVQEDEAKCHEGCQNKTAHSDSGNLHVTIILYANLHKLHQVNRTAGQDGIDSSLDVQVT